MQITENCATPKIMQFIQLLNLICRYGDVFYGSTGMLMSKNVNSNISKDLPIERLPAVQEVIVSNSVGDSKIFFLLSNLW